MKTGLAGLQGVIFSNNFDLTDKLDIAQLLNKLKSVSFNNNPTILPLPTDAPLEVPRIILRTDDDNFNLNISPIRIDLFYNNKKLDADGAPIGDMKEVESKIISILQEVTKLLTTKYSIHIPRLALIANIFIKLEISSKKYLIDNFIKDNSIQNSEEMHLNFLFKKDLGKYKVNEWLRFQSLRNLKNPKDDSGISLSLDLNSFSEVNYNFDKETLGEFYKLCFTEIKKEINLYTVKDHSNG